MMVLTLGVGCCLAWAAVTIFVLRVFSGPSIQSVGIAVSRFNVLKGVMGLGHCKF